MKIKDRIDEDPSNGRHFMMLDIYFGRYQNQRKVIRLTLAPRFPHVEISCAPGINRISLLFAIERFDLTFSLIVDVFLAIQNPIENANTRARIDRHS